MKNLEEIQCGQCVQVTAKEAIEKDLFPDLTRYMGWMLWDSDLCLAYLIDGMELPNGHVWSETFSSIHIEQGEHVWTVELKGGAIFKVESLVCWRYERE